MLMSPPSSVVLLITVLNVLTTNASKVGSPLATMPASMTVTRTVCNIPQGGARGGDRVQPAGVRGAERRGLPETDGRHRRGRARCERLGGPVASGGGGTRDERLAREDSDALWYKRHAEVGMYM